MLDYVRLPIGMRAPERVNAVIEIPRDSVNKYEYDKHLHVFRLDRTLHSSVHYPGDYGFIPCTLGLDDDPLDVLVLVEAPSFPGCLMEVRPIGVLRMVGQGKKDEKILAVAESDPLYRQINDSFPGLSPQAARDRTFLRHLQGPGRQEDGNLRLGRDRCRKADHCARAEEV